MSEVPRTLLPVLLPPDAPADGLLVHDLLGRGAPVPALPRVAFVLDGQPGLLRAGGDDPWLADAKKVRSVALANLARRKPRWTDVRDAQGAVVAVALDGPHAPVRVLEPKVVKEAARLVGAQEVWLAWTAPERLEAVDAWRAPVGELGDALRARTHGGAPVLVARKGKVHGVLGPGGATLPLPEPAGDADADADAPEGPPGPPAPTAKGGVAIVLFFVLVGVAAAALALATS
jgi:hypothetical protein